MPSMYKSIKLSALLLVIATVASSKSQTIYVDALKGNNSGNGTLTSPVYSLGKAIALAAMLPGDKPVTIKLAPGLYLLDSQVLILPNSNSKNTATLSFEAMLMPDDTAWQPSKMPVIQSISGNNKDYGHFNHCIGFQVERDNVCFKGLKFIGNARPDVGYYYAIERHKPELKGLEISQCYFVADKNSLVMQGAVFAQGAGINIDHCIFYGCKNAVLVFQGLKDFSLTHSIIYGAYEGAFWYGYGTGADAPFTFHDNIVADCNYFLIGYKEKHTNYNFTNSVISGNAHLLGFNGDEAEPDTLNTAVLTGTLITGKVLLREITDKGVPRNYLHPTPTSAGYGLDAGIFIKNTGTITAH